MPLGVWVRERVYASGCKGVCLCVRGLMPLGVCGWEGCASVCVCMRVCLCV